MQLLDGRSLSRRLLAGLAERLRHIRQENQKVPHLAAILVGNDPASHTYVQSKMKACETVGIQSTLIRHDAQVSAEALMECIHRLNADSSVDGILLQLPLPAHLPAEVIASGIAPEKDVDGFHFVNAGKMLKGLPCPLPATPYGILLLLEHYGIETAGKHCVIVGRSDIVGRPLSVLLSRNASPGNCTVTLCHSKTRQLESHCRAADLLVAAIGRPNFITANMVKEGAVVIDVGINRIADASRASGYRLAGDVHFDEVAPRSSAITPVPGGVGPMTIAALLYNTMYVAGYSVHNA